MLLALLFLACAQAPHAALHPVGADLYAETPNLGATIAAYEHAPAVKLVSSEGAANIAALAKDLGLDLASMTSSLLPIADPARPDDRWWPWSAARKASFSLSGIEALPQTGATPTPATTLWLVCDFGARDAAEQAVRALIVMGGVEPKPAGELTIAGVATPVVEIGSPLEALATKAWIARVDERVILGAGAARPDEYATRSAAIDGGLVAAWKASEAEKIFPAPRGVTVVEILSDLDDLPSFAQDNAMLAYAAMFTAPFLSAKGRWRIELQGDRFTTEGLYEPRGAAASVLGAFGRAPVAPSAIEFVPPDAVGTWLTDADAARAESAFEELLRSTLGDAPIAPPAAGEARMSDGLKSTMAVSLLPFQSVMSPAPRAVMTIALSDEAKFQAGLDAWLARAQAANPALTVERKPYRKVPTITIGTAEDEASPPGGGGSPFSASALEPSRVTIAVLPDRVIFGSAPSVARNEIKRVQEKADVAPHAATKAVARPDDAFEVSTMDWSAFLSKLYDGARAFAPMLGQNLEKPIDVEKLPTAAQLFTPFRTSTSWSKRVGTRIHTHAESSFGPETPVGIAAFAFLGMRAANGAGAATPVDARAPAGSPKPTTEPALADGAKTVGAAPDEARTATLGALREVRTAIAVYRSQFARAPATTADLLVKTDAFPDAFLKGGRVPNDGWGRALVYSVQPDGSAYTLHSTGADGVDQQGAGDDVRLP